jgi:hypothetical protein
LGCALLREIFICHVCASSPHVTELDDGICVKECEGIWIAENTSVHVQCVTCTGTDLFNCISSRSNQSSGGDGDGSRVCFTDYIPPLSYQLLVVFTPVCIDVPFSVGLTWECDAVGDEAMLQPSAARATAPSRGMYKPLAISGLVAAVG